jgi:hypothetical protein
VFAKLRFAAAENELPKGSQNRLSHVIFIVFDGEHDQLMRWASL